MLTGRVRFGPFEADAASGELWRDGVAVPVQDLPFRVLGALIERPGAVVTRAELAARLWRSDTFADATAGLNTAVAKRVKRSGTAPTHRHSSRLSRNVDIALSEKSKKLALG
jgi:DNA-binding winged helix-turn-helix (wHTH) protein